jgi:hypothetical protein
VVRLLAALKNLSVQRVDAVGKVVAGHEGGCWQEPWAAAFAEVRSEVVVLALVAAAGARREGSAAAERVQTAPGMAGAAGHQEGALEAVRGPQLGIAARHWYAAARKLGGSWAAAAVARVAAKTHGGRSREGPWAPETWPDVAGAGGVVREVVGDADHPEAP